MQLDLATFLLQWATGGLLFCWVTTRRREVGLGYGWLLRISFGVMAILSRGVGRGRRRAPARWSATWRTALMALAAGRRACSSRTCDAPPACAGSGARASGAPRGSRR